MRSVLSAILLACGLITMTAQAVPIVLYDNGAPRGDAQNAFGLPYESAFHTGDDFLLSAAANTITGVQFNGFALFNPPVTALDYYIYTAAGSVPGVLLASGDAQHLSTVPDGLLLGYQAAFDLVTPLSLANGRYYLVLGLGSDGQYIDVTASVAPGTSGSVSSTSSTPGSFTANDVDLAFRILGNSGITPAPEPSGFLLSGSLIGGVLLLLRKRLLPRSSALS